MRWRRVVHEMEGSVWDGGWCVGWRVVCGSPFCSQACSNNKHDKMDGGAGPEKVKKLKR